MKSQMSMPDFSSPSDFIKALNAGKHQVRAAGNVRVLLLGLVGRAAARKPTRPVATGTFSFPAFGTN
jgi:hypothetical protein